MPPVEDSLCSMDLSRRDIRTMIFYDMNAGLSSTESHERLTKALGMASPCYATVKNWFAEFRRGRLSLDDEQRESSWFRRMYKCIVCNGECFEKI